MIIEDVTMIGTVQRHTIILHVHFERNDHSFFSYDYRLCLMINTQNATRFPGIFPNDNGIRITAILSKIVPDYLLVLIIHGV